MSESTTDHSGNNDGTNGEMVHDTDKSAASTNLVIDATMKPPPVDNIGGEEEGFVSPRTLILEAKSSEEDLPTITNTNVKAKHKWIEETLLKDTDGNNNKPPSALSENTQKILARHSLSGNSSSGVPPRNTSTKEDVLARARKAIDDRRKSKEILSIAKAKVHADLASMGDNKKVISTAVSTSCEQEDDGDDGKTENMVHDTIDTVGMDKSGEENNSATTITPVVNDVRAKAQARLNASKALLAANSLGKKTSVPKKSVALSHSEGENNSAHNEGSSNGDDRKENEEEVQTNTQLKEEKVAAVADNQAELDGRCEQEIIGKEMSSAEAEKGLKEEEDIQRQKEAELRAEKLEQQRLATEAAKQAVWEKLSKQRQEEEEEERRLEQERMKLAKQVAAREAQEQEAKNGKEDDVSSNNDTTQASINFDPIMNDSSSFSTGAEILNKLSETSSAGQLDRMLYQGKRRAQFNRVESEEEDNEDEEAIGNSSDESASQVSLNNDKIVDGVIDNVKQVLPHGISNEKGDSQSSELHNMNIGDSVAPAPSECDDDNTSANMNFDNNVVPNPREDHDDSTNMGPMWTRARKEAEMAASWENEVKRRDTLAEDNIDHSPSIVPGPIDLESNKSSPGKMEIESSDPENSQYHNQADLDANPSTDRGLNMVPTLDRISPTIPNVLPKQEVGLQELSGVWKGFNRKRMKVQVAIFGLLLGLIPSLYVVTTCHFITGNVHVGDDEIDFGLYYGLNEFSPVDSAFSGYGYCQNYDSSYGFNPPIMPRAFGIGSLIIGMIAVIVIGIYLRFNMTDEYFWVGSMWLLGLGFILQLGTLSMFFVDLCEDGVECSFGKGAYATIISAISWLVLSIEMKVNSPLIQPLQSEGTIVMEKDSFFVTRIKKVWYTVTGKNTAPSLSRTAMEMQKDRIRKKAHGSELELGYRPPLVPVVGQEIV